MCGRNSVFVYERERMHCNSALHSFKKMLDNCKHLGSSPEKIADVEMAIRENERKLNDLKKIESKVYWPRYCKELSFPSTATS